MSDVVFAPIPAEHRETARAALTTAFGGVPIAALRPVVGGASGALTYRVEIADRSYLLRMETRRSPLRNPHQYICMQSAADAGVAPPLHHADDAAGVAIMDFLPPLQTSEYPGGPMALARDLGRLVSRLQATPPFPRSADYLTIVERLLGAMRSSHTFAAGLLDPHQEGFERIRQAYPWDASTHVSAHNDPNPRNIIFDGTRLWLVDWETSYLNDPLTDVAILIDNFAPSSDIEDALLQGWFGCAPDRPTRARLLLMRPLTRLYYAGLLLSISTFRQPRTTPDADLTALTPAEFGSAATSGALKPGPETLYALGKMHLAGFLAGVTAAGFEEALIICRG